MEQPGTQDWGAISVAISSQGSFGASLPVITSTTRIKAPAARIFDLARSREVYRETTLAGDESTMQGEQKGLLQEGDEITWLGKHLGFQQTLTLRMSEVSAPELFVEEMVEGAFRKLTHRHSFESDGKVTHMKDEFDYVSRRGLLGFALNNIFLTAYLRSFLAKRNKALKEIAESDRWQQFLPAGEAS